MTDAAKHRLPVLLTNEFTSKERQVVCVCMLVRACVRALVHACERMCM